MAPLPLTDALTEGRERTLALVEPLSDADVESQHVEIMSPLVWDLAHIAAYEELWLAHREARPRRVAPAAVGAGGGRDDRPLRAAACRRRRPAAARSRAGARLSGGRPAPY